MSEQDSREALYGELEYRYDAKLAEQVERLLTEFIPSTKVQHIQGDHVDEVIVELYQRSRRESFDLSHQVAKATTDEQINQLDNKIVELNDLRDAIRMRVAIEPWRDGKSLSLAKAALIHDIDMNSANYWVEKGHLTLTADDEGNLIIDPTTFKAKLETEMQHLERRAERRRAPQAERVALRKAANKMLQVYDG